MRSNLLIFIISLINNIIFAQTLRSVTEEDMFRGNAPMPCHVGVNDPAFSALFPQEYDNVKRAVFKIVDPKGRSCSATLVNRNTSQADLGQYFVTAWHCFKEGADCSGAEINFNTTDFNLVFNFQSKNADNIYDLSTVVGIFPHNYNHRTKIRLVDKSSCALTDYALCEILTPIPPHFNVYYAGWDPSSNLFSIFPSFAERSYILHHPSGGLKRVTSRPFIDLQIGYTVEKSCRRIAKLVDFLFGWFWGRKWLIENVCNYVNIPFIGPKYKLSQFQQGKTEKGSSGSGYFSPSGRLTGDLSAGFPDHQCNTLIDPGFTYVGKFYQSYLDSDTKNVLNPPQNKNTWVIDQTGIPGRQITCYENLNLFGNYYPLNSFQAENRMVLSASNNITNNSDQNLHIFEGAEYQMNASNISLNNLQVDFGANFSTNIRSCTPSTSTYKTKENDQDIGLESFLDTIPVPEPTNTVLDDIVSIAYPTNEISKFEVYPNPANEFAIVEIGFVKNINTIKMQIFDLSGKLIEEKNITTDTQNIYEKIETKHKNNGLYTIVISWDMQKKTTKLVINH